MEWENTYLLFHSASKPTHRYLAAPALHQEEHTHCTWEGEWTKVSRQVWGGWNGWVRAFSGREGGGGGCYMWACTHKDTYVFHCSFQCIRWASDSTHFSVQLNEQCGKYKTKKGPTYAWVKKTTFPFLSCYKVYKFTKCTQKAKQKWSNRQPKGLDPTVVQASTFFLTPDSPVHQSMTVSLHRKLSLLTIKHNCTHINMRKKEGKKKVPPRFELGSLDSESRVLTVTPWNQLMQEQQLVAL